MVAQVIRHAGCSYIDVSWTPCRLALMILAIAGVSRPVAAQEQPPASPEPPRWSAVLSTGWYFLPDDADYIQPTLKADRSRLHLEARYAYEDRHSLSIFAGANFRFGDDVKLAVTPMFGALVGDVTGVIPAFELNFTVWRFQAYGEAEYVFNLEDSSSRFFYMWSELSVWPVDWARVGLVTQHTHAYMSERDIDRGPLIGVAFSRVAATLYLFNPEDDGHLAMLSIGVSF
jgi:hypothetical protein